MTAAALPDVLTIERFTSGTLNDPHCYLRCELGELDRITAKNTAAGWTVNAPPIVGVGPDDRADILRHQGGGREPFWSRDTRIVTTLRTDESTGHEYLTVTATNGSWVYRLYPAIYQGDDWHVGAWPD